VNKQVRFYISACFYYSGLVKLARWWTQRSTPSLTILYYHQASRGNLRSHWLYLRRHYRILPLEAALAELRMPLTKAVQSKDQRPLLAVTFDDGYYHFSHSRPYGERQLFLVGHPLDPSRSGRSDNIC
jgi:hypothetical protein